MKPAPRRVRVTSDRDLAEAVEAVGSDGAPRIIERNGKEIAVVVSPKDYEAIAPEPKSRTNKEILLSFAGIWSSLDADKLIADIYRWRHESPPSDPVKFD